VTVKFHALTMDCADAARLAGFWAHVLGRRVDEGATAELASIDAIGPDDPAWFFVAVPEGKAAKNRVHPDLSTTDLDGEVQRIIELGATRHAAHHEDGYRWVTLLDPEGNEFDVIAKEGQ
jgi:catechol 2,3-dioxygenase-like lactoylglutathione lyase family enzyme